MKYWLVALLLIGGSAGAQVVDPTQVPTWINLMDDPEATLAETQDAFEAYWQNRERTKGDGWKVYKRWEHFWMNHLDSAGRRQPLAMQAEAFRQWNIQRLQQQSGDESENGDWEEIGPINLPTNGTGQPNGNGRLNAIGFHPTDSLTFWVGAPAGGFWKTTDGGQTWSTNTDDFPSLGVSSILVDANSPSTIYLGTGDRDAGDASGIGVYKTTNGGTTWGSSGLSGLTVGAMSWLDGAILAATSSGIYRSVNGGTSWTLVSSTSNFKDLKARPGSASVAYASETSGTAGFYRTLNGGQSWTEITSGLPTGGQRYAIGVSADDTNVVYVLCSVSSAFGGLYRSTNGGQSFSLMSNSPNLLGYAENGTSTGGQGWYDLAIEVDPTNADVVYVGGVNVWKSTNGGSSWDCVGHWVGSSTAPSIHADQHWFAFNPADGALYLCNDGGVYKTTDGAQSYDDLTGGLGIAQIYKIGVSALTNELVINGYQDNGTALWDGGAFRTERGGDGMESVIDHTDDNYVYASVYYGDIARSSDGGYNFGGFAGNGTNGITEDGAWVTPYTLDKDNGNIMFIGYKNVWRTSNAKAGTPSFTPISNSLAGSNSQNMRQLRQSKVNSNRLFALRYDGKLFRSDNALASNPTWTDLSSMLPGTGTVYDVETHPTSNATLWIARGSRVWKSTNSGISWSDISGTLPTNNKFTLVADPLSDGGLYVGGAAGVYYRDNNLSDWVYFGEGLPESVEVTELEIYHEQGNWPGSRLRAGTYGRGLWQSDLYDPGTLPPMAFIDIPTDSTDVCGTDTVVLVSNSAYGATAQQWTITPNAGFSFVGGTSATSAIAKLLFDEVGTYAVKLVVSNANGADSLTVAAAIEVTGGVGLPYFDDLEGNPFCAETGCATNCETLLWKNVKNGWGDDVDWRPDNEGTPWSAANYSGGNTGPSTDYNPGTYEGTYFYLSSYPPYAGCYNQVAELESPCILLDSMVSPKFKFAYHRFGYSPWMGDLDLDVRSNGNWTTLWSEQGNQGDVWLTDSVSLNNYLGDYIKLRFVGHTGSGWQADVALDDFGITGGPVAAFSTSDSSVCAGTTVLLNDQSTQQPTSHQWTIIPLTYSFVGGTSATSENPQVVFHEAGFYTVILQVSNAYGSDLLTVTNFISVAKPEVSLNAASELFCENVAMQVSAVGASDNYAFVVNGTVAQQGTDSTYTFIPIPGSNSVSIIATDSQGCTAYTDTMVGNMLPTQAYSLVVVPEGEICSGDTITATAQTGGTLPVTAYGFGLLDSTYQVGSDSVWHCHYLQTSEPILGWALLANGCRVPFASDTITVAPQPPAPQVIDAGDSLFCSLVGTAYRWRKDSVVVNGGEVIAFDGAGWVAVRYFDGQCWSAWSEDHFATGVSYQMAAGAVVFPNPTDGMLYLSWPNRLHDVRVTVFDSQARALSVELAAGAEYWSIDLSTLAPGAYTLLLQSGHERAHFQVVHF